MALLNNNIEEDEYSSDQIALEPITATQQADQILNKTSDLSDTEPVTPEGKFKGPVIRGQSTYDTYGATSRVDLSKKENVDQMWKEYDEARLYGRKPGWKGKWLLQQEPGTEKTRDTKLNLWYHKYYGMSQADYEELKSEQMNKTSGNPLWHINQTITGLSTLSAGASTDWVMDAIGSLPGLAPLDNWYDRKTKTDNPVWESGRQLLSIIVPSMLAGNYVQGKLSTNLVPATTKGGKIKNALIAAGGYAAADATVLALNDAGEEHNLAGNMAKWYPGVFGEQGYLPFPEWYKTLGDDSPSVRKWKNMLEAGPLSIMGVLLGAFVKTKGGMGTTRTMEWFEPLDDASAAYKTENIINESQVEKLIKIQEIDTQISIGRGNMSSGMEKRLINEKMRLVEELDQIEDLDAALDALDRNATKEQNISAVNKLRNSTEETKNVFDPDINPTAPDASKRQSVGPGTTASNMATTTAIKNGNSVGDPAPVITEAMRAKGLMAGNTSRGAVMGVAEETRMIGRFNALVDGFRYTTKQMNAAAWDIYTSIIAADNLDDVKALFLENKDVKSMLLGRFKVEYINEEQARAAAFAMRDLVDRYLGRQVAESSARVMDTLGREASTLAESIQEIAGISGPENIRTMDLIIDKMQFLMDEYALNKYISGWQLRNKNWFDNVPPKELDTVLDTLQKEFRSAENAIHSKNLKFTKELKKLAEQNPLAVRPLVDAFAHTNGDVDSLAKLQKWASQQITPTGMLKSPDPKQLNLFARSAWGVIMNNVLSGLSPLFAGLGNTTQLIVKPITGILGHGIWGAASFDGFEGLKRHIYYNGAMYETNRRALRDALKQTKKAHRHPELLMKSYRKDFIFQEDKSWEIMADMANLWEATGDVGKLTQYNIAVALRDMAKMPGLRYGMTGMVFADKFAQVHMAHYLARSRAYDDVFSEFGFADWKKIAKAEKKHYDTMFDKNGMITDKALEAISGELALNLDDGLATWINKGTTAYPMAKFLFMFPRTNSNSVKNALSWTPISLIPGINKYSKTIWAKTDDEIAEALFEHGIDMATLPNARVFFENLRAEYTGRIAFSSLLTKALWDYALAGNVIGNGHYNASRRAKERNQLGVEPGTIIIANKVVDYTRIPVVAPTLKVLGDIAYYARDLDQAFMEDIQAKLMWTIAATFLNDTPLQGLEPLVSALNGDLSSWNRVTGGALRTLIPQTSALAVLNNAITSSLKDLDGSIIQHVQNKIPIAASFLPEQRDFWTNTILNDIRNPFLRVLNAFGIIKVSAGSEPWRKWLLETGWNFSERLKKDSTGSYEYSNEEREQIIMWIQEEEPYKDLIPLMNNKKLNEPIGLVRAHRSTGNDLDNERIKLKLALSPLHKALDQVLLKYQRKAEQRLVLQRPDIANTILHQLWANKLMKQGDVEGAIQVQKQEKQKRKEILTENLLQMSK